MRSTQIVAALLGALSVTVSGCSLTKDSDPQAQPAPTPSVVATPTTADQPLHDDYAGFTPPVAVSDPDQFTQSVLDEVYPLREIRNAPRPVGSGPQIALRFLQALQRHDHIAAAKQLAVTGRVHFGTNDGATLDRVMTDVAHHAGLSSAGPCTHARPLNDEAAVVTCGTTPVVVHVSGRGTRAGVRISDWFVHRDVYPGPHTHGYTTYER